MFGLDYMVVGYGGAAPRGAPVRDLDCSSCGAPVHSGEAAVPPFLDLLSFCRQHV